jgi:hypothetical protein
MIDQRHQSARSVHANRAESLSIRLLRERFEAMPAAKRQETRVYVQRLLRQRRTSAQGSYLERVALDVYGVQPDL